MVALLPLSADCGYDHLDEPVLWNDNGHSFVSVVVAGAPHLDLYAEVLAVPNEQGHAARFLGAE